MYNDGFLQVPDRTGDYIFITEIYSDTGMDNSVNFVCVSQETNFQSITT